MTAKIKLNAASGGGSFSLQAPSSSSNNRVFTLPDSADATLLTSTASLGKILQVKNAIKVDQFTTNSQSFVDITGLSLNITPTSSSNKVLVSVDVNAACQDTAVVRLVRDSTTIAAGTGGSGEVYRGFGLVRHNSTAAGATYCITFLDTLGDTNSHTYKVQGLTENGSVYPFVVNRRVLDTTFSLSSSITVMEVAT